MTRYFGLSLCLALLLTGACVQDDEPEAPNTTASQAPAPRDGATTPSSVNTVSYDNQRFDRDRIERERFDETWRSSADLDRQGRTLPARDDGSSSGTADGSSDTAPRDGGPPIERLRRGGTGTSPNGDASPATSEGSASSTPSGPAETWDDIGPNTVDIEPRLPLNKDSNGPTVLYLQVLLDHARFSPGVIDGRWGKNTEKAVYWLQDSLGMEPTGDVDRALFDRLEQGLGERKAIRQYRLTAQDLEGPFQPVPDDVAEKAEMDCLCYESLEESLAERFHTTPELLAQLNPDQDMASLRAGQSLWVPSVAVIEGKMETPDSVDRVVVSKKGFYVHALDKQGRVLYHFPSTLGTDYDPTPGSGEYEISSHAYEPAFHYQPKLFADVPDEEEEHMLPGGPNSPVGMVWLDLSKPHYGIHGTSEPQSIGYTNSHGCIRLTNWDALFLANHVADGTKVEFRQ